MKIRTVRARAFASTVIVGAAALSLVAPAFAQTGTGAGAPPVSSDAPLTTSQSTNTPTSLATPASAEPPSTSATAPSTQPTTVQEVVVTGSLFRRTNTETPSPVTVLTANDIAKRGLTTISDAIRSISADSSGTIPTAFGIGFAAGASGVSLRGLTAADTLVLIDGLRTANYPLADDGVRSFQDLNTIPLSIVDHVEVLKDGASSQYGSDAVAGVVNIITKQTFKGIEADAAYGDSQHGGGQETRANIMLGHGDLGLDGYNIYVDGEYQEDQKISVGQRGFPFNTNNLSSIGGQNNIGGQPNLFNGSIYGSVAPTTGPNAGTFQVLRPSGCGVGSVLTSTPGIGNYCEQNLTTYGDDQPAEIRWSLTGRATKQLPGSNQAFVDVIFSENKVSINEVPPQIQAGAPINTNNITLPAFLANGTVNPNNPFGTPEQINYLFGDIPGEATEDDHVIRGVAGVKGDLFGFNYEGDVTIAHQSLDTINRDFVNYGALQADISDGAYSFVNPASNTAAVINGLAPALEKTSTTDLDSLDLHATRDLYQLPGGPLSLGIGGQVRYEAQNDPDLNPLDANGNPTFVGLGIARSVGHRTVEAFFFEVDAPVDKTLDLDFSGRYDHYSDFGGTFNPKLGVKWTPFRQIAFRGTYSEGFRAPSFSQNGSSASEGFVTYQPTSSAPASFVNGHNNDGYVQSYTLAEFTVANPAVKPENTESFTAGFIYEPFKFINVSVDYYHIHQTNLIAQLSVNEVLADYYAGQTLPQGATVTPDVADPAAPGALARPSVVEAPFVNANSLTTDGVDVDFRANYRLPFDVHFASELNATDIFGYQYTTGGSTFNYVGTEAPFNLSSGAGTPKYRANWSNSFTYEKATITGTLNYVSDFKETGADVGSVDVSTCLYPYPKSCQVRAFYDFDLTGSYQLTSNVEVYANVLNLFDSNPPQDPANYAGINYNPTYAEQGIIGRYFRIGAHLKF